MGLSKENLTPFFKKCCVSTLSEIFETTEENLENFVDWHTKNLLEISNEYYFFDLDEKNELFIMDTQDRGVLYDIVAMYFTDYNRWPLFCDGDFIYNDFKSQLVKNSYEFLEWKCKL